MNETLVGSRTSYLYEAVINVGKIRNWV